MPGPRQRVVTDKKIDPKSLSRLLKYVFSRYGFRLAIVAVCLVLSSVSSVIAATFMQRLIDEIIYPGIVSGYAAVEKTVLSIITTMAIIYMAGVVHSP